MIRYFVGPFIHGLFTMHQICTWLQHDRRSAWCDEDGCGKEWEWVYGRKGRE